MVTYEDIKTLEVMIYLLENLRPALKAMEGRRIHECCIGDLGNIEYCSERVHADLRKVRRLAMILIKNTD